MDVNVKIDVYKERLLTLLSDFLRYAEKNQIDLNNDITEFGKTYKELVTRYNHCRYIHTEKDFAEIEKIISKAKSQLAYKEIFG